MKKLLLALLLLTSSFLRAELIKLNSLTLEQAEMIAVENNNQVNEVRELLKKAKEGKLESLSKWMPKIEAMYMMARSEKKQFFSNSPSTFFTQLALTQSIFSSDIYYDIKIADLVVEQLRLLLNAAVIDILYQVRVSYYQVILDHENIHAALDKVELLQSLSKRMQDRYDIGTSILYNVNQSKVAIANATSTYYDSIKQLKVDLDKLANVLGYDPGDVEIEVAKLEIPVNEIPEIKEKLEKLEPLLNEHTANLDTYIFAKGYPESEQRAMQRLFSRYEIKSFEEKALKFQPNLKAYENEVAIAKQEVAKQIGEYMPNMTFNFNYGGNPSGLIPMPTSRFTNQEMQWGVGVSLNWLVFDSLGRERRVRKARFEKSSKEFRYKKGVQDAFSGVRKSIFEMEESAASFLTAASNVKLATQTVKLADDQLDIGYSTIFDYQITVDGLIQAVNTKNKAKYDLIKSYYSLVHATGEDLENHLEVKK